MKNKLEALLKDVQAGRLSPEKALETLQDYPYRDLGFAKVDHHREVARGCPEVVFGLGKTPDKIVQISREIIKKVAGTSSTTGSTWQFPVLVKKRFSSGAVRPYIGAGPAFQHLFSLKQVTHYFTGGSTTTTDNPAEIDNRGGVGGVLEGGFELHMGPLKVSPELRYTRWGSSHFALPSGSALSNQNQAEFLLGITF